MTGSFSVLKEAGNVIARMREPGFDGELTMYAPTENQAKETGALVYKLFAITSFPPLVSGVSRVAASATWNEAEKTGHVTIANGRIGREHIISMESELKQFQKRLKNPPLHTWLGKECAVFMFEDSVKRNQFHELVAHLRMAHDMPFKPGGPVYDRIDAQTEFEKKPVLIIEKTYLDEILGHEKEGLSPKGRTK